MTSVRFSFCLACALLIATVPACNDSDDVHHEDASTEDATGLDDSSPNDSEASLLDHAGDALCSATCGSVCCESDQICCLDQHGHNPTCVAGAQCVPPLQPIDGG